MIIGLTGTYCSGKNFIASLLEKRGFPVLDVDKLGHQVIETEKNAILGYFGNGILASDGKINRKLLGQKVFGKEKELKALEDIVHPAVNRESMAWIKAQNHKACFINAALLHKSEAFSSLDAIVIVNAPFITRLYRARKRDKLPLKDLLKRLDSQKDFTSQYFSVKADIYRVENPERFIFGFLGKRVKIKPDKRLQSRLDEILSSIGLG